MLRKTHSQGDERVPRVVVLGGGFAGLNAAKGLRGASVSVTLIDRRNYHLFQPLLYQVATASLSPADIAQPIRRIVAGQPNCRVMLAEATGIDGAKRIVRVARAVPGAANGREGEEEIPYDYLVVATGATHSYFGHDEWSPLAPGLKDIPDATEIRRRFLLAFESAEREPDESARRARLTFVVVGGGATGVELAGAMAEIARRGMRNEYRRIDTTKARVVLFEGEDRVLPTMDHRLSERAQRDLRSLGVETLLRTRVTGIDHAGVWTGEGDMRRRIDAGCVVWAAGVQASSLGAALGTPTDRAGRVEVGPDLAVPGRPEVFVVGDLALVRDGATGKEVPGIAPAAMQMGRYVARTIAREAALHNSSGRREKPPIGADRPPFRYRDKGMLATIGRARAVADIRGRRFVGYPAWLLWLLVHIFFLIGFRNRLLVLIQWAWAYITFDRGARLITVERRRPD